MYNTSHYIGKILFIMKSPVQKGKVHFCSSIGSWDITENISSWIFKLSQFCKFSNMICFIKRWSSKMMDLEIFAKTPTFENDKKSKIYWSWSWFIKKPSFLCFIGVKGHLKLYGCEQNRWIWALGVSLEPKIFLGTLGVIEYFLGKLLGK